MCASRTATCGLRTVRGARAPQIHRVRSCLVLTRAPSVPSHTVLLTARLDAVLADFDSARVLSDAPSRLTEACHRAPPEPPALPATYYIAPELMRAANGRRGGVRDATPAADMFAFGMLLTRMAWPTKSMRRIISSSRVVLPSTDSSEGYGRNGDRRPVSARRAPALPGSAKMPSELARVASDCVVQLPWKRPTARRVLARVSSVNLTEEPVTRENSPS